MTPEEIAAVAGDALARALEENIALRCLLGGGCDANNDGLHTTLGRGKDEFCIHCGEMTRNGKSRPWFDESRLERTIARLQAAGGEG
jgi:hypothetical protein